MLFEGIKNSIEELALLLADKIKITSEDDIVMECNPTTDGCDILVIIPVDADIDKDLVERFFRKFVINKAAKHPYNMYWQRTQNKIKVNYIPSVSLESLDIDFDGYSLIVSATIAFNFD